MAEEEASRDEALGKIREGIAYICENLARVRRALAGVDADDERQLLGLLRERVLDGGDPQDILDAIHATLLAAGDARGIYARTRGELALPGMAVNRPVEIAYLCPVMRCLRVVPGPLVISPKCNLTDNPLHQGRI
jgi:hypothetical protein